MFHIIASKMSNVYLGILKTLAIPALFFWGLIAADVLLPLKSGEALNIAEKVPIATKNGADTVTVARNEHQILQRIFPESFSAKLKIGDQLRLHTSQIIRHQRRIEHLRNGEILQVHSFPRWLLLGLSLPLLLTLLPWTHPRWLMKHGPAILLVFFLGGAGTLGLLILTVLRLSGHPI
ncbi:MAG TPA: hypothetical protein PKV71_13945 [Calditrichia bacterium]|nr:hypothetical protein [Calditrichota bacterium]HQU72723.1 hypothetical protein [Calditrichia bacterium]HQV32982.1 hypothetical protein [Calditrichia bacterium]